MIIHPIQQKLLRISQDINLKKMSLREIAGLVDESHPQKISHHLNQLEKKNYIKINKRTGRILILKGDEKKSATLITVPVLGSANCGAADIFADENIEGYLKISKKYVNKERNVFAIKAQGPSMNKANIKGHNIENGDYVIIDAENRNPNDGDYVLSVIDNTANIKRFYFNKENQQIALISESIKKFPPIYIHSDDKFMINGVVKNVIKTLEADDNNFIQTSARDIIKNLGPISKEEVEYYENL